MLTTWASFCPNHELIRDGDTENDEEEMEDTENDEEEMEINAVSPVAADTAVSPVATDTTGTEAAVTETSVMDAIGTTVFFLSSDITKLKLNNYLGQRLPKKTIVFGKSANILRFVLQSYYANGFISLLSIMHMGFMF